MNTGTALYNAQSDNVNFEHPEYIEFYNQVHYVQNVYDGTDSVKQYLKMAPREEVPSFVDRQSSIAFKNFVKRAIEAFVGMIFRKSIQVVGYSDDVMRISTTIDKKSTLNKFSRELATTLIRDGRVFIAVDSPVGGEGDPYFTILNRASVINWRKNELGQYTLLVYRETIQEPLGDFGMGTVEQWRVFKENGDVDIWRHDSTNGDYHLYQTIETEFDYIPIVDIELSAIPPLYDVAKLSIKHMNRTSFKDKYLDMAAIPVPVIWDAMASRDDMTASPSGTRPVHVIGVDEAFVFTGTKDESDFQWRELSGNSIRALQDDLAVIEDDITSGVIRASQSDNTTIKTATQSFYEAAESSNRVTVIANALEIGLNKAMTMLMDLLNEVPEGLERIIVNKDYNATLQDTNNMRLLWEMFLGGALSTKTLLASLEQFEMIEIGSVEDEITRIKEDDFIPIPKVDGNDSIANKEMDNRTLSISKANKLKERK